MDVDVDFGRVDLEVEEIVGHFGGGYESFIGLHDCFVEEMVTHESSVDEEILQGSFPGCIGVPYETGYFS